MELKRALEIFEYNKAMLTCDMSVSRDPEHQDVSPDYYGKEAEDLYYAIVCVEKYIKNAVPVEWIRNNWLKRNDYQGTIEFFPQPTFEDVMNWLIEDWEAERGADK